MCAQSMALGTHTKFQLDILTINGVFGIVYFRKISLESARNVSETTPRASFQYTIRRFIVRSREVSKSLRLVI